MKVLVFEPNHLGHRLQFVGILANALAQAKFDVVAVVGRDAVAAPEGQAHLANAREAIEFDDSLQMPPRLSAFQNSKYRLNQLLDSASKHRPDHIFIPYGDGLVQLMGMGFGSNLSKIPSEALILRGSSNSGIKGKLSNLVHHRLYRRAPCKRIHFLNPFSYKTALSVNSSNCKFKVMPEPVEDDLETMDQTLARQELGMEGCGKILACLGGINLQKNVPQLIDAFLDAKVESADRLLLVGKQDHYVQTKLEALDSQSRQRIIELNRYVENQTFLKAIVAADVVTIPYKNRAASSGIMVRAVRARKRIITDNGGLLGWLTKQFNFGLTCDVSSHAEFSKIIADSMSMEWNEEEHDAQKRFREFHTVKNFCDSWLERLIQESCGHSNETSPVSWDSVIAGLSEPQKI